MLSKKLFIYKQSTIDNIVTKKILNKDIYGKYFVRSNLNDLKNIHVLDNNNALFNVPSTTYKSLYQNSSISEGSSLNVKNFLYKNNKNNVLRFKSYLSSFIVEKNLLNSFFYSLKSLKNSEQISNSLIVLRPVKGGFSCYSSGIVGFLPRSHGNFFFLRAMFFVLEEEDKITNLKFLSSSLDFNKKFFVLRLPFEMGKITIYSRFKRNNFSLSSRRKKKEFLNDYNFVFLSQRIEKKYHNKKILNDAKIKKISGK